MFNKQKEEEEEGLCVALYISKPDLWNRNLG